MRYVIFLGLMAGCHSETVDDSDSNPPSTDKTTSDSGVDTEGEPAVTTDEREVCLAHLDLCFLEEIILSLNLSRIPCLL